MIDYTTNGEGMNEATTEKKPFKRRVIVTSMLTLAALGAHYFHSRTLANVAPEPVIATAAASEDNTMKTMAGPNSLLGAMGVEPKFDASIPTVAAANELDMSDTSDQAGIAQMSNPALDSVDSASSGQFDIASGNVSIATSDLSSVPEPTMAGLVLLVAAAPAVGLRRPRSRRSAGNLQLQTN